MNEIKKQKSINWKMKKIYKKSSDLQLEMIQTILKWEKIDLIKKQIIVITYIIKLIMEI